MKVCHFAATKGLGRGEAFVEIANELAEKIEISLLVPEGALFLDRVSTKVEVQLYREQGSRRNLPQLWQLYKHFKATSPDLVHTHFGKATELFLYINRFLGLPHLATKHNPRKGKVFEKVKYATAVSREAGKSIKNPETSVIVIRNGLTPEGPEPDDSYEPLQPFPILAIGRLDPIKGFDLLIDSLSHVEFPFHLSLAGDGEERFNLETLAKQKLPEGSYTFLGFRKDIPNLMRQAALVVASSHSEGCPMAMIEAFFYANIFLSTPVGEAADLLPKELLCDHQDMANKLTDIHDNFQSFRQEFRNFCKDQIPNFKASSISEKYLQFYDVVLSGKKPPKKQA